MPAAGFLRSASLTDASYLVAGFRQDLTMMLSSKTFRASWSIGLAAALVTAVAPGPMARAENMASEGTLRHLRALQDIASESGGNRAAGTLGYDRSAEYVAETLKEAGYRVYFEEFEFPFFEERVPPVCEQGRARRGEVLWWVPHRGGGPSLMTQGCNPFGSSMAPP
jgi:hypothetical protein